MFFTESSQKMHAAGSVTPATRIAASKLLREDMAGMGPVRARDCEEAQSALVRLAKDLADRGEILLVDPKSDDAMII